MRLPRFDCLEPTSLQEACSLLREHGEQAAILAGGTDLLVRMKQRTTTPRYLVNLRRMSDLDGITDVGEGLRIGALTTLYTLTVSPLIQAQAPILAQVARRVASPQIRYLATWGLRRFTLPKGRPVKIELTREEVFTATRQRHPAIIEIKTGVKKDGTILAQEMRVIVDNGAYRGTGAVVIFLMHAFNLPIYRVPNLKYDGYAVYTNNPVRGPQRAHGAPQVRFAVDSQLDMIARELGLDAVEVMLRNARHKGEVLPNGDQLSSCGLSECIRRAAEASGWREKRARPGTGRWRRGIGLSACSMFSGAPFYPFASAAAVQLHDDGGATLFTGTVEMGQGAETTLAQIVAEELGVSLSAVRVISGDTELCPIDLGCFLSGGALVTGDAVRAAAADARRQLLEVASDLLDAMPEELEAREGRVFVRDRPERGVSLADVVTASIQRRNGDPIMGRGHAKPMADVDHYPSLAKAKGRFTPAYGFAVSVAEVEVDTQTGKIRPVQVHTFHDCGFALNPKIVEGQIHGNVSMGEGQALWEEVVLKEGQVMNPSFLDYKLPTAVEASSVQGREVASLEPHGPFGAKEAGEGSIASVLAAIANAVHDAVGVRVKSLPITHAKILNALGRENQAFQEQA